MSKTADEPPLKAERKKCYDARDKHWNCLDNNNEDEANCKETRKIFESLCAPKWVDHFDKKYRFEKWKSRNEAESQQKPQPK